MIYLLRTESIAKLVLAVEATASDSTLVSKSTRKIRKISSPMQKVAARRKLESKAKMSRRRYCGRANAGKCRQLAGLTYVATNRRRVCSDKLLATHNQALNRHGGKSHNKGGAWPHRYNSNYMYCNSVIWRNTILTVPQKQQLCRNDKNPHWSSKYSTKEKYAGKQKVF